MIIKLNVYDENFKTVKKEVEANTIEIPFGVIRKFMALFNVATLDDNAAILSIVMKSWTDVVKLLDRIFPGMTEEDWDGINTKELLEAIKQVLKYSFSEMLNIPVDQKN